MHSAPRQVITEINTIWTREAPTLLLCAYDCISVGEKRCNCIHGGPNLAEVQDQRSGPQAPLGGRQSEAFYGYIWSFDVTGKKRIRPNARARGT